MKSSHPAFGVEKRNLSNLPDNLTATQKNRINNGYTNIYDHITEKDVDGAIREIQGNGLMKPNGTPWQHYKEVNDAVIGVEKSLKSLKKSLKNPNLEKDAKAAIKKSIEDFKKVINQWNSIKEKK